MRAGQTAAHAGVGSEATDKGALDCFRHMLYTYARKCIYVQEMFQMSRWNLVIPDKTDRMVRTHIASNGGNKGDLSKFVDTAVRQRIFHETVREIKKRNAGLDPQEAQRLADEAVAWAREDRS